MGTLSDCVDEINKQKNTLTLICQMLQRSDLNELRLVTNNCFNFDQTRIDIIRQFLQTEKDEVQAIIDNILSSGVSGC